MGELALKEWAGGVHNLKHPCHHQSHPPNYAPSHPCQITRLIKGQFWFAFSIWTVVFLVCLACVFKCFSVATGVRNVRTQDAGRTAASWEYCKILASPPGPPTLAFLPHYPHSLLLMWWYVSWTGTQNMHNLETLQMWSSDRAAQGTLGL